MKIFAGIRVLILVMFFSVFLPLTSGAVQLVAPISDSAANGWTNEVGGTSPLWSKVNDYGTDTGNTTWIRSANGDTSFAVLNLGSMTTPTSTSCTVRYYANASGASGPEKITLDIYQGGASVTAGAQISGNITRGSYNSYTATLNVTGATDWGALQVALAANNVAGSEYVMVSRLEVECPDPPTANNPPVINTAASTTATEDTLYSYDAAIQTPDDGPSEIWSLGAANTCSGSSITAVTGIYTFTPAGPVPPASCLLDIQVCDGATPEQCDTETVTINITAVNDPPAITSSAGTAATEDTLYSYTATATDGDGPGTTWFVLGTDTCGGAFAGNVYSFTPAGPSPLANCDVSIQVCDGGTPDQCATQTTTITIAAINDPPAGGADSYSTAKNTPLSVSAPGVLNNDSDPEGGGLTAQNATGTDVGGATVSLNANGSFTYTPKNNYTGADGFSYDVCDVGPLCVTVRVDITVTAGGDTTPPTVTSTTPVSGATDVALDSQVTINFSENIDCTTVNTTNITNTSPGWTLFSCSGSQAIFNTSGQANSTTYSVNVTTSVTDLAANPMSAPYPFSYTTSSGADATKPKVISFTATTPVTTSVNIPVTVFTATDNVGVTGYMITQNSTPPNSGDASWTGTPPATYSATAGDGTKTLYPWVKDAADNVSDAFAAPAGVVVDGTGPTDGTLTVTAGDTLNSLSWTAANDGTGVGLRSTGRYEVRFAAGATAPADCAAGTSLYTGNNLTFAHAGLTNTTQYSYRVCAYDALANISSGATGSGTPMVADTPTLSGTTVQWSTANKVSSAKTTTATLGATLNASGTSAVTARGIVWSASNTNPTIGGADVTTVAGSGTALGAFTVSVTGLPSASRIYFQGYAANGSGTSYSGVNSFWTEPDPATAPAVNAIIPGENYFDLTVNYDAKPANADGMLLVVRQSYAPNTSPFDGTVYTANTRIGSGSATDPNCLFYCEYVVADITAATPGSVTVTGLKAGINHYFALYAYTGSGSGLSGINYVQTINAAMQATASVPLAGRSHNEVWVAGSSPKDGVNWGTMTSTDCANCHGSHHTSQLLPTGVDMYDKCYTCHQDGGAADDNTADAKINMALHLSDGSVDCGTCHSMHSFRTEELYSVDNQGNKGFNIAFVRSNMAKYFNTGNGFATNALEPTVFQNRPTDFANVAADAPYNAVCQTCHTDVARTPHHQQVATDDHQAGMDCMTCHTHRNSAGKMGAFTPGGHDATHFPWDATTQTSCGTAGCHDFAANPDVVGDVHSGVCTVCHSNPSGGDGTAKIGDATFGIDGDATLGTTATPHTDNCLVCHPAATYDRSTVHHNSKNGYAAAGTCTQCHAGTNYPGDHAARVSLATNCADCHDGTQGSASGIPVDPDDATVAERKVHDACTTCHNTDGDATLMAPYGVAQAMPDGGVGSGNGGGSCEICHTSGFGGYHATVGHAATVNTYVNCATCHTATAGTASDIPTSVADNKVHDACTTCHGADGRLINSAATHNGGTDGGSDAVNNCSTCHGEYFSSHTNIDHTAYVAAGGLICTDCHTATAGTSITVPVDPANNKKHDACSTCHQATGVLKTFALADTHDPDWIAAMPAGGGSCAACHGAAFFTSSHSATHDARFYYDTTGTGASVDILQNNGSAGCATCHNDAAAALATFAAISQEHLNDCNKCHTEIRDINESAATGTTVRQWIAARAAETTTDTNCRTCHVPNWNNVPNHAGHNATDFAWDATTQTSCGAVGCHDSVAKPDVVADVHGGTCTICHSSASGGDGTTKIGSATNGVDGNATLGSTSTPHTDNCLVCHNIADADVNAATIGGIHHDNKTDGTVTEAKCTAKCHTVTGFKGNHSADIASTTNCSTCHAANSGDGTGAAPVNATNPKMHDGCTTSCHTIAAIPAANGILKTVTAPGGSGNIIAGDCNTCHGTYFPNHTNINHSTSVAVGGVCDDCHSGTAGNATTVPVDPDDITVAARKLHDACSTCHTATGVLVAPSGLAVAMPNGGDDGGTNGGGTCVTCHSDRFTAKSHSASHDAKFYYDTTGTGASVDILQNNGSAGCADCHNDAAAALATFAAIFQEHLSTCDKCHKETRDINESAATGTTVRQWIAARAAETTTDTNCRTCHVPNWNNVPNHAGHNTSDFAWDATTQTSCGAVGCHDSVAKPDVVNDIHGGTCTICHSSASGGDGTAKIGSATNGVDGDATLGSTATPHTDNCLVCHNIADADVNAASIGGIHHDNKTDGTVTEAKCTSKCHTVTNFKGAHNTNIAGTTNCTTCHTATGGDATGAAQINGTDPKVHDGCTISCHTINAIPGAAGVLKAITAPGGSANIAAGNCNGCHGAYFSSHTNANHTTLVSSSGICGDCHTATAGTATTVPVDGANNMKHDSCGTCHNTTTGALLAFATADLHNPDWIAAMPAGGGNCAACHGATYFSNTGNHYKTHDAKFYYDTTGTGASVDILQANGSAGCASCHNDAAAALATFAAINQEHLSNCDKCHIETRDINETTASGTTVRQLIANRYLEGSVTDTNCRTCHVPNWANSPNHAGHATTDFAWTTATKASCGTAACHDWANTGDVIATIHNGTCTNCHNTAGGGDGTTVNKEVGNATLGSTTPPHTDACTVCHTFAIPATHHQKTGGPAALGNCVACHPDPRPAVGNIAYNQLVCRVCHVKAFGASGIEITDNVLQGGTITGANGTMIGNLQNTITGNTHQFPKTATIQNYGACFHCHGNTGKTAGRATKTVKPMHALPVPTIARTNLGTVNVLDTNQIGGGGYQVNNTIAPNVFPASEFKGANPTGFSTIWNTAYYPMGKERLNLGWTLHSQSKKAANIGTTKENNAGIITNAIFNIPAGLNYGTATLPHDAGTRHFLPHFDPTPGTLGVDTLTGTANAVWPLAAGGTGPIGATRSISVNVSSNNSSARLSVIYGGRVVWTGTANGQAVATIDIGALAASLVPAGHQHVYASAGTGAVFVVSDKGGSIKLRTATNPGQGVN